LTDRKKFNERFFVEWSVRQLHWDCEVVDDENPDFGIKFSDKIIGLEATNLYKDEGVGGSFSKQCESFRDGWLLEVSRKYYIQCNRPILVEVLIEKGELKGDAGLLASELIRRSDIDVWKSQEFELELSATCQLKIWLDRIPDSFQEYNHWTFLDNHIGNSRPITNIVIQEKVRNKATQLPKYMQKYSEVVLLIVSDRTYQSGIFHPAERISTPSYGFTGVYLAFYPESCEKIG
jgi:hypothetical protein